MSFNFMAAVTVHSDFGAHENKVCQCFHFPPSICHEVMGTGYYDFSFLNVEFEASFFTLFFHSLLSPHQKALVPLHEVVLLE